MTQPTASADTRALALEMFKDSIPCALSLEEPPCPNEAAWIAYFRHLSADDCGGQPPLPFCDQHRGSLQRAVHPFWRAWFNTDPMVCDGCGAEITVDRFEAIT